MPGSARKLEGLQAELLAELFSGAPHHFRAGRRREPLEGFDVEPHLPLLADPTRLLLDALFHAVPHDLVDVAQVEGEGDASGDDVDAARFQLQLTNGSHGGTGSASLYLD